MFAVGLVAVLIGLAMVDFGRKGLRSPGIMAPLFGLLFALAGVAVIFCGTVLALGS